MTSNCVYAYFFTENNSAYLSDNIGHPEKLAQKSN